MIGKKREFCVSLQLAVLLFLQVLGLFARSDYQFERLTIDDGLSQSAVNCIAQDRIGYMWFGTQEGLNRFDGYTFKIFKHVVGSNDSLSDHFIWCIVEDRNGFLWIGTNDGGLNRFDPRTETFKRFLHDPNEEQSLSHNYVTSIYEEKDGTLWIGTDGGGLHKLIDKEKGVFKRFSSTDGIISNRITSIGTDSLGQLWVGALDEGLFKMTDRQNEKFTQITHASRDDKDLDHLHVNVIYLDPYGVLWVGTEGGLFQLSDPNINTFVRYTANPDLKNGKGEETNRGDHKWLSHNDVRAIWDAGDGKLWIGTYGGGVNIFEPKTHLFTYCKNDAGDGRSLLENRIRSIFKSKEGLIWIGTDNGLNIYNHGTQNFQLYRPHLNKNSLNYGEVRCFHQDKSGILWVGTFVGGLNRFNRSPGVREEDRFSYITKKDGLSHNDVRCLWANDDGTFWLGTWGGGLNHYDPKTGKFNNFKTYRYDQDDNKSLSNDYIRVLYKDSHGILWVGTNGGLNRYNPRAGNFERYKKGKGDRELSHSDIFSISEDRAGTLWIGTRGGGLNKLVDRGKMKFQVFRHNPKDRKSLSHDFILSMHEDAAGDFWIGTFGGGLNKMDREKGTFISYTKKDGLPNGVIYGILEDKKGNLWLSTNRGLSRFNPRKREFRNFYKEDGLQSNEFNRGAYYTDERTGEMFFGGLNGFNIFDPAKIKDDDFRPPAVITELMINGEGRLLSELEQEYSTDQELSNEGGKARKLKLTYRDSISFEFAALYYSRPKRVKYRYKLEGYDREWLEIKNSAENRRATYAKLPAGDYIFRVQFSLNSGNWSEMDKAKRITLSVSQIPWKTGWAIGLYILIFLFILYGIRLTITKKMLKREVERKTGALKAYQSQLAHSDKMVAVGTLTAGVAHELLNPITYIRTNAYNTNRDLNKLKTYIEGLAEDDEDEAVIADFQERFKALFSYIKAIQEGTIRSADIVNNLRTFSRMDKGEMQPLNLIEGLQSTLIIVRPTYKKDVTFVTNFREELDVVGNGGELNQVFMNLIINGCQAIIQKQKKEGDSSLGTFRIDTSIENDQAVIRFQDSGVGMDEALMERIFDPFFTTKPEGEGTGLGLSTCEGIIKNHGGKIDVSSEPGIGATFTVRLPLSKKKPSVKSEANGSEKNEKH